VTSGELEVQDNVGVHWLAGITRESVDAVLSAVVEVTGESVEVLPRGALGYATRYRVGHVQVLADGQGPQAEAMGVHLEVTGAGCEALGFSKLRDLAVGLDLRVSRFDLAVDGCPFTPSEVWAAWTAGNVRTRVKVAAGALAGREWRSGKWMQSASGDTAYLGSSRAARMVRVYDRRETGTRLELQVRHGAAHAVASDVFGVSEALVPARVLGHVRAFVDFVEGDDANVSRRPLALWWSSFVGHVERSGVRLAGVAVESFEAVVSWLHYQVGPLLAVLEARRGFDGVERLIRQGRRRWSARHNRLSLGGVGV